MKGELRVDAATWLPRAEAHARFHPAQRLYWRRLHAGQNCGGAAWKQMRPL